VPIRKYKYISNYTTVLISMIPMSCVKGDKKKALVLLVFFNDGSHSVVFTVKQATYFVFEQMWSVQQAFYLYVLKL
jgi:hypothetical protein